MSANAAFLEALVSMGFESSASSIALEAACNDFDEAVALLRSSQASYNASDASSSLECINQVAEFARDRLPVHFTLFESPNSSC
jgi:hypothetical protein